MFKNSRLRISSMVSLTQCMSLIAYLLILTEYMKTRQYKHSLPAINHSRRMSCKCSIPACLARNSHHSCKMSFAISCRTWTLAFIYNRVLRRQPPHRTHVISTNHNVPRHSITISRQCEHHRTHEYTKSCILFLFHPQSPLGKHALLSFVASISFL